MKDTALSKGWFCFLLRFWFGWTWAGEVAFVGAELHVTHISLVTCNPVQRRATGSIAFVGWGTLSAVVPGLETVGTHTSTGARLGENLATIPEVNDAPVAVSMHRPQARRNSTDTTELS